MKKGTAFLLVLCLLLGLTACGASSKSAPADFALRQEAAVEAPAAMEDAVLTGAGETGSTVLPENRKWIITVNMEAETEDLETLLAALDEKITSMNGYVENQSTYNGSNYASRRYRSANLTIRIPADRVEAFTEEMAGIANVVSNDLRREDITLRYVATESRMKALQTEEARLLELMGQAENMSDLLEIEARLTDVRYELESVTSQMRTFDNQIDYATIYLYINEVQQYTPVAERTVWERIRDGFGDSLEGLGESIVDFFVWIIVASPYLVVWAIVVVAAVLIIKRIRKGRPFRTKAKKSAPDTNTEES